MKTNIITIFSIFFVLIFSAYAANAKSECALKDEKQALDVRAMQSHLMVAALSCDQRNNYNIFMKEHKVELIQNTEDMKNYFRRNYSSKSESQLNNFITRLANESSKKSLSQNLKNFCAESEKTFAQVKGANMTKISSIASKKEFAGLHKITACN